jgi:exodeoxyribonuclease VII small subunit
VAGNAKNSKDVVPFEDALKRLETIVESMEAGDLPLETLLARFEEGTRMVKVCQERLEQAELKIKQLEKNPAGEISLTNLDEPSQIE